ncbi:acetyl-CoA carboxylase biotin carboxyl carrier protein subunit [Mangrovibacillus cuniculi]|uniref:Acetyl-CoA carboxylase biotin carboxyl carrier protein subunit n=1 Tax=Mangrovibacillus cuniculi TaxID=2593652 RepID=A0A7S8CA73_9BACI|nr:acetyl-CoA carboxylase biotin carboxyl carrier protein subunit [Mangrovibacillus cuniculi]QPC46244.1 acetyl-CoA carboxylase biotin carboxyl carrier protein subunit [Mangrovibacillus cuniculi]
MEMKSPMTGTMYKVEVSVGDHITVNDVCFILESMKMEIPVQAERQGKVISIEKIEGDFVQEGDVLLVLEVTE